MKDSLLQFAFGLAVLVLCAGLEELLPKLLGVGFPLLLTATVFLASARMPRHLALLFAVSAGAIEDALSSLPAVTSVSFFLMLAVAVRRWPFNRALALAAYPCYQVWLAVWSVVGRGEIFGRLVLSLPIGAMTVAVVGLAIREARRGVAADERD